MTKKKSRKYAGSSKKVAKAKKAQAAEEKKTDFATEYLYVLGDLRRIAILAAAMFALLIVLAFVLA